LKTNFSLKQRWGTVAAVMLATLAIDPAMAQALAPVTAAVNIIALTTASVCLGILSIAWGTAGYNMAFNGANFRDVSKNVLGGAVAGGAGTIAAVFI
jgi:hypothetical protein